MYIKLNRTGRLFFPVKWIQNIILQYHISHASDLVAIFWAQLWFPPIVLKAVYAESFEKFKLVVWITKTSWYWAEMIWPQRTVTSSAFRTHLIRLRIEFGLRLPSWGPWSSQKPWNPKTILASPSRHGDWSPQYPKIWWIPNTSLAVECIHCRKTGQQQQ